MTEHGLLEAVRRCPPPSSADPRRLLALCTIEGTNRFAALMAPPASVRTSSPGSHRRRLLPNECWLSEGPRQPSLTTCLSRRLLQSQARTLSRCRVLEPHRLSGAPQVVQTLSRPNGTPIHVPSLLSTLAALAPTLITPPSLSAMPAPPPPPCPGVISGHNFGCLLPAIGWEQRLARRRGATHLTAPKSRPARHKRLPGAALLRGANVGRLDGHQWRAALHRNRQPLSVGQARDDTDHRNLSDSWLLIGDIHSGPIQSYAQMLYVPLALAGRKNVVENVPSPATGAS